MTIQEVAEREGVSVRQAQRYCRAPGFLGHVLKAAKVGKAFHIEESDYRQWRIDCGWEQAKPVAVAAPPVPQVPQPEEAAALLRPVRPAPAYPPYPLPADPVNGVLTNAPHERSSNHPHPLACEDYMRQEAENLLEKYRGSPNDDEE